MMDREYQQLRFDISEKVRLHPQQPGIKTLVELDLYPDVEIEDQETHLRIHGYLRLAGRYAGDEEDRIDEGKSAGDGDEADAQEKSKGESLDEIAFVIPVEITLPSDRVDIDRLATEVESFDYQVLSPFELQVEAVLVIDGLLPDPKKEEGADSESVVSFAGSSFSERGSDPEEKEEDEVHLIHVEYGGEPFQRENERDPWDGEVHALSQDADLRGEEASEEGEADTIAVESSAAGESPAEEWVPDSFASEDLASEKVADTEGSEDREEEPMDDPRELEGNRQIDRVRFGLQSQEEDQSEHFDLARKLLRKPSPDEFGPEPSSADAPTAEAAWEDDEGEAEGESVESAEAPEDEPGTDQEEGLHWARRFLGEKEDTFVKMRMVIVQKDESLESLADRYDVSPSQILRLNGLDSGQLEEGQIIYIPGEERKTPHDGSA